MNYINIQLLLKLSIIATLIIMVSLFGYLGITMVENIGTSDINSIIGAP